MTLTAPQRMALLSIFAALLTLALKFAAYFATGSVSLYSDAMESFVNLAAAIVALIVLTVVATPADEGHPYGHDKAEYFSSGVEGGLILLAALTIIYEAVKRLWHPEPVNDLGVGLLLSLVASGVNGGVAWLLMRAAKRHDSITLEADAHHLLTDVWTSAGVVAGLAVLLFAPPSWVILDPIIAILVALNIVMTGVDLLRRSLDGLMDATLPPDDLAAIQQVFLSNKPPQATIADLKTRKAGAQRFIEFKLRVPGDITVDAAHTWCDALEQALERQLSRSTVTIHVEPAGNQLDGQG
ncbi:cation diffusion facilitator family transporter [Chitinivorax tropicus]|uniref:Cation diffusion facilitator family transporter n=1 Tax=Chitinivorax tropicus TaxID=714531 RepID=A0A840MJR4_9PROT|nr:cation diffusion facilitator family transporter [Chitinivorax tropicus]MBB5016806.1 cation diffusion facilitator family transporter [Chitinivorax tropicus]